MKCEFIILRIFLSALMTLCHEEYDVYHTESSIFQFKLFSQCLHELVEEQVKNKKTHQVIRVIIRHFFTVHCLFYSFHYSRLTHIYCVQFFAAIRRKNNNKIHASPMPSQYTYYICIYFKEIVCIKWKWTTAEYAPHWNGISETRVSSLILIKKTLLTANSPFFMIYPNQQQVSLFSNFSNILTKSINAAL